MKKRTLGRTGLRVSELCLGTLNFGWFTDRETSLDLLDQFTEAGGNFVQTAGVTPAVALEASTATLSESLVGEWMASRRVKRSDLIVATQLAVRLPADDTGSPLRSLEAACEASLRRLQTDYLDVVICQWQPEIVPDELLQAMTVLVQRGKVRYFGLTNCPVWRVAESFTRSAKNFWCRLEAVQADYSLLERSLVARDTLDFCHEHRAGFLARSPLAGGLLTSKARLGQFGRNSHGRRGPSCGCDARRAMVLRELDELARVNDVGIAPVALAWVLRNPVVTAALVGAQSPLHLEEALAACRLELSPVDFARLDAASSISPLRAALQRSRALRSGVAFGRTRRVVEAAVAAENQFALQ